MYIIRKNIFIFWLTLLIGLFLTGVAKAKDRDAANLLEIAGVYYLPKANAPIQDHELASPDIVGVSVRSGWGEIESEEGKFNWQYLDEALKVAERNKKKVMFRVIAGMATPKWVYTAGAKEFKYTDPNPYHRTYGQTMSMVIPWDEIYLSKWKNFIRAFGKRYDGNSSISIIQMTGPARGGEMHLEAKKDKERWQQVGYSNEKLVNAWKRTIDAYAEAFPDKYLAIDIAKPVLFDDSLKIVEDVLAYGYQKLGKRFCVQGNWLAAKTREDSDLYNLIKEYSSKTIVGFQMLWSASAEGAQKMERGIERGDASSETMIERPRRMGRGAIDSEEAKMRGQRQPRGDRMGGTLREAIEKGLAAGASYLEIYGRDIRNPGLKGDIQYAAERLKSSASAR